MFRFGSKEQKTPAPLNTVVSLPVAPSHGSDDSSGLSGSLSRAAQVLKDSGLHIKEKAKEVEEGAKAIVEMTKGTADAAVETATKASKDIPASSSRAQQQGNDIFGSIGQAWQAVMLQVQKLNGFCVPPQHAEKALSQPHYEDHHLVMTI